MSDIKSSIDPGFPLWMVASGMFLLTLLITYPIAYIAVIIYMQDHISWFGTPDLRELTWAIQTFFGLATLFPTIALLYSLLMISYGITKEFFEKNGGQPLDHHEKEMFESFLNEASNWCGKLTAKNIRKYDAHDINAWALGTVDAGYMSFSSATLKLPQNEIKGIFFHELGHLVYGDTRKMAFTRAFQDALVSFVLITPLKDIFRYTIFILTQLVVMKISRDREYRADSFALQADDTDGIIYALYSIKDSDTALVNYKDYDVYMFSLKVDTESLFATHPPLGYRISKLIKK
ncbi:M48 family metalloprotease [Vibrio mangrovi]|uniref:M48 family metalloprotease n=1 Tax=Vibrio mangrovi TaxID=474394 RepID=A0A1Y6J191_9VIBR|nr:M48 family metalloprotease [Vibrio mangrovi]MDW6002313.1 M48 family metalloprotease [Vibrio mangrovi]SMS03021.1 Protease HtpX [Vibrio mangrovi]